jgi:hypothetical protein
MTSRDYLQVYRVEVVVVLVILASLCAALTPSLTMRSEPTSVKEPLKSAPPSRRPSVANIPETKERPNLVGRHLNSPLAATEPNRDKFGHRVEAIRPIGDRSVAREILALSPF